MQLAATPTISTANPNKPWSAKSPAAHSGIEVGSARIGWGVGESDFWWSNNLLRTGQPVGATEGYSTLREAMWKIGDLTHLTKGNAALVLQEGDRFFGRRLQVFTTNGYDTSGGSKKWHVVNDKPGNVDIMQFERGVLDPRVKAFVDGDKVHRFVNRPYQYDA